eukprot:PhF_6_TR14236/c0_g1_i1/m.22831
MLYESPLDQIGSILLLMQRSVTRHLARPPPAPLKLTTKLAPPSGTHTPNRSGKSPALSPAHKDYPFDQQGKRIIPRHIQLTQYGSVTPTPKVGSSAAPRGPWQRLYTGYKEKMDYREQIARAATIKREAAEVVPCTFHPQISPLRSANRPAAWMEGTSTVHERLYSSQIHQSKSGPSPSPPREEDIPAQCSLKTWTKGLRDGQTTPNPRKQPLTPNVGKKKSPSNRIGGNVLMSNMSSTWDRLYDEAREKAAAKKRAEAEEERHRNSTKRKSSVVIMGTVSRLLEEGNKREQRLEEKRQKLAAESEAKRRNEIVAILGHLPGRRKSNQGNNARVPKLSNMERNHPPQDDISLDRDIIDTSSANLFNRGDSLSELRTPVHHTGPPIPPLRMPLRSIVSDLDIPTEGNGKVVVPPQKVPSVGDYDYMEYFEHYSKEENAMEH